MHETCDHIQGSTASVFRVVRNAGDRVGKEYYKRLYWVRNCVHIGAFQVFLHDLFQLMSRCLVFLGWSIWKQNSLWLVAWALVPTW